MSLANFFSEFCIFSSKLIEPKEEVMVIHPSILALKNSMDEQLGKAAKCEAAKSTRILQWLSICIQGEGHSNL